METFNIFLLRHRGMDCLGVRLGKEDSRNAFIRKIPGIKWSQTNKCWYGERSVELEVELLKVLGPFEGSGESGPEPSQSVKQLNPSKITEGEPGTSMDQHNADQKDSFFPNAEEIAWIKKLVQHMEVQRLGINTIINYKNAIMVFLKYFHNRDWRILNQNDIEVFQKEVIIDRKLSSSYQNLIISSIKKFYEVLTGKKPEFNFILRPKQAQTLPNVLSREEMQRLLTGIQNMKHRMMLSTIYACGLRAGDLLNLQATDILSDRGLLHIKSGKGNKDRVVPISLKLIIQLREYFKIYKPKTWLFEGQESGKQYSKRSLELVMQRALKKAGIVRKTRLHDLRHTYATHLLEAGTNQLLIQNALGHKNPKTTAIYTHVSKTNLSKMFNPFDDLNI